MTNDNSKTIRMERHILDTYFFLRLGLGLLGLSFPVILWALGKVLVNTPLQESMSAYYYTGMRNVFVGVLFTIAFFLLFYKGFTRHEDWALNIAAFFAIGIAIFPMNIEWNIGCRLDCETFKELCNCLELKFKPFMGGKLHGTCAVLFFAAIGYVSVFLSTETLYLVGDKRHRNYYKHAYRLLGWAMFLLPLIAWTLLTFAHLGALGSKNYSVFFVELAGVWVFALYWLIKTYELRSTKADATFVPTKFRPKEGP